jgi:hypothetical protein
MHRQLFGRGEGVEIWRGKLAEESTGQWLLTSRGIDYPGTDDSFPPACLPSLPLLTGAECAPTAE